MSEQTRALLFIAQLFQNCKDEDLADFLYNISDIHDYQTGEDINLKDLSIEELLNIKNQFIKQVAELIAAEYEIKPIEFKMSYLENTALNYNYGFQQLSNSIAKIITD